MHRQELTEIWANTTMAARILCSVHSAQYHSAQCTVSQCSVHPHMHCHVMHSAASRLPQSQSESSSKSPSTSGLSPSPSCASSKSKNRQSMRIVLPSASVAKTIDQNTNPAMFEFFLEHKKSPRRHLLIALQDSKLSAIKRDAITITQEEESSRAQSEEDGSTKPNHMCQRKLINSNQSKYHLNKHTSAICPRILCFVLFTFCVYICGSAQ